MKNLLKLLTIAGLPFIPSCDGKDRELYLVSQKLIYPWEYANGNRTLVESPARDAGQPVYLNYKVVDREELIKLGFDPKEELRYYD